MASLRYRSSCFRLLSLRANALSYFGQTNGFSPVWTFSWNQCVTCIVCLVIFQTCKFLFSFVGPLVFPIFPICANAMSQFEQANGYSLVWIPSSCIKHLITFWEGIWFLSSVDSFTPLQVTTIVICLVRLRAGKWPFSSLVFSWVFKWPLCLNVLSHSELANSFSLVWIFTCLCAFFHDSVICKFLCLSISLLCGLFHASSSNYYWFRAGKWLLSSVDSFMGLQVTSLLKCLVTFRAGI